MLDSHVLGKHKALAQLTFPGKQLRRQMDGGPLP